TAARARLGQQEAALLESLRAEARAAGISLAERAERVDGRVPVRLTRGPLDFGLPASKLPAADAAWYGSREMTLSGDARFELVNFIDGTRTVGAIRDALAAEYGPVSPAVVGRYLEDLVKVGVARWR
ncbi:MAG: hypothetical protein HY560_03515, partial [Gemmatimonadetes bacterium]|nr:hypothetical protein [Gemmatimonadota bacterium]